jgi:hypothetical protein
MFTQGVSVGPQPQLTLPLRRAGDEVDVNFCDFDMVVIRSALSAKLHTVAGSAIQRIPVTIEGRGNRFEILNVCGLVECVDESRSLLTEWTADDGRREKTGQFRMIAKLKIMQRPLTDITSLKE